MHHWNLLRRLLPCLFTGAVFLAGQEPATRPSVIANTDENTINAAAIAGAKQDPAAVERGGKAFRTNCAGCHGAAGNGGPGAPDLVRSLLVLDDEKGILIAPVIREGRPDKGMPKLNLSEPEISDIVAWLHVRTYAAGHRTTYTFQNVLTGDAKKGEAYFNGAGKCSSCHSASGDLAGIGKKYDALALQSLWLQPRTSRRAGRGGGGSAESGKMQCTVIVKLRSGETVSGKLDRIDDFTVSLRDADNKFRSFDRTGDTVAGVTIEDPLQAHTDMLRQYTDADVHNMTAYLASLK